MKRTASAAVILLLVSTAACSGATTGSAGPPESLQERASYALGFSAGESLTEQGAEIDLDQLVAGLRDSLAGNEARMSAEQMQSTMVEYQQQLAAAAETRRSEEATANKEAGDAFLAENADKPGVVVMDSGLQYEVITEGEGASPQPGDEITAHYEGRLIDGTVFDSSIANGTPMTIRLNALVPGFVEGLQQMKVGSKHRLFIPGELGYGSQGAGGMIGPNETLIFEVELLAVNGQS